MCGRSLNHQEEEEIENKKAQANTAWMSNKSEIEKRSRKKGSTKREKLIVVFKPKKPYKGNTKPIFDILEVFK